MEEEKVLRNRRKSTWTLVQVATSRKHDWNPVHSVLTVRPHKLLT